MFELGVLYLIPHLKPTQNKSKIGTRVDGLTVLLSIMK